VISGKASIPVLGCVRLTAGNGECRAQATDLDQVVEFVANGTEVFRDGACIIPFTTLKDLAKGARDERVELYADASGDVQLVNHVGGHAVSQPVAGMDLDEWPAMNVDALTQRSEGFLETYRRLLPFASTDETRYVLNGVYIDTTGKGDLPHALVATDGRRLAMFNSMRLPVDKSLIIPASKFLASAKLSDDVEIGVREDDGLTWFGLASGPWRFAIKTVDGTYPNYRQVIPAEAGEHVVIFTDEDVDVLQKVIPAFPGDDHITLVGDNGRVTVYGREGGGDWTTLTLETSSYSGERSFIGVDRHYLLDALKAGFREFAITDELCPMLSRDDQGGTHVLMPMRVEDPEGDNHAKDEPDTAVDSDVEEKSAPPVEPPAQAQKPKRKPRRSNVTTEQKSEAPALDRVQRSCDTARVKIKEAGQALTELSKAIRDVSREQRAQEKEVEAAKAAIAKVQQIKLAA